MPRPGEDGRQSESGVAAGNQTRRRARGVHRSRRCGPKPALAARRRGRNAARTAALRRREVDSPPLDRSRRAGSAGSRFRDSRRRRALGVSTAKDRAGSGGQKCDWASDGGRPIHRCEIASGGIDDERRGEPRDADSPGEFRSHRIAADGGGNRRLPRRFQRASLRANGRAVSQFGTVRRAVGQILAGCRRLCGLEWLLRRRHRPPAGLSLSRLRHPVDQRRQTVGSIHPGTDRGRRVGRLSPRRRRAAGDGRTAGSRALHPQQSRWNGQQRRQPGRTAGRQVRRVGRDAADHGVVSIRRHGAMRPVSRSQIRAVHPARLLPIAGRDLPGAQRRAMVEAERSRHLHGDGRRTGRVGTSRPRHRRSDRRPPCRVQRMVETESATRPGIIRRCVRFRSQARRRLEQHGAGRRCREAHWP